MKKRLFGILAALCFCLLLPTVALADSGVTLKGKGTESEPYLITSREELFAFADIVNGTNKAVQNTAACAKVTASIRLNNMLENGMAGFYQAWTPIGSQKNPYCGTFTCDDNVVIYEPYVKDLDSNQIGFFGYIDGATIQNVTLEDVLISGNTDVGGLAGVAINSTIEKCIVSGVPMLEEEEGEEEEEKKAPYSFGVRGSESVGGIVGRSEDSYILECHNKAAVYLLVTSGETARHKLGGIAGVAMLTAAGASASDAVLIEDCQNEGKITCTTVENYECTGGIVGRLVSNNANYRAVVKGCYNFGNVSSIEAGTGGIVGYAQNASIEYCENIATITGTIGVGGIAGYAYYGTRIVHCDNIGNVEGNLYDNEAKNEKDRVIVYPYSIGGIVGSIYNPRDTSYLNGECNSLPVYSYNNDSVISYCTNGGNVSCNFGYSEIKPSIRLVNDVPFAINMYGSFTGGIAGFAVDSAYFDEEGNVVCIKNCMNTGTVTGAAKDENATYTGGILGVGKNVTVLM